MAALASAEAVERLWGCDHTLFGDAPDEIADRLGWLESPGEMGERASALQSFADGVAGQGFTDAVLMGMGGSSLFPEVAARTFGDGSGALNLHVMDTTDPAAILRIEERLEFDTTLFVAASKSGTTIETRSQLSYFWERVGDPDRFLAISDPGSPLATLARDRQFRAVFENRPDIGGRYSALSHFGLVPMALVGGDLAELLSHAVEMAETCRRPAAENPGARLGAVIGAAAHAGRDKLTLRIDEPLAAFGAWVEQLVAESTGKAGRGIVPVDGEAPRPPGDYADDRLFVTVGDDPDAEALAAAGHPVVEFDWDDPYALGGEVFRWEVATAMAGRIFGINPFDQPDVQAAKDATAKVLSDGLPDVGEEQLAPLLDQLEPGDYLVIQAYVDPGGELVTPLRAAADRIGADRGVASTFGLGPRYLHSTGQLHKGGPANGVFVQVVEDDPRDVEVPDAGYTFGTLKRAQAAGDLDALKERGLRAGRVSIDDLLRVIA